MDKAKRTVLLLSFIIHCSITKINNKCCQITFTLKVVKMRVYVDFRLYDVIVAKGYVTHHGPVQTLYSRCMASGPVAQFGA